MVPMMAACRVGFQDQPDSQMLPAPPIDVLPIDAPPPPTLACGAPIKFPLATAPTTITATATAAGYNLITGDAVGVHGFSYKFVDAKLVADRGDVLLFTGPSGELSSIANGDQSLLSVTSGMPMLDTTTVIALDAQLGKVGMPAVHDAWVGGLGSLARGTTGILALLGIKFDTGEIDAQAIVGDGASSGPPHVLAPAGSSPTVAAAGADFLVTWDAHSEASGKVHAAVHTLTGDSIVTKVAPQILSTDPANDAFNARGDYSAATDTYLFAWMQKPGTPADQIRISRRDHELNEVGIAQNIGNGNLPYVVAGKDDFVVAWRIDDVRLGAARVRPDGSILPVEIVGTAQHAIAMDLVVREGQPVLVWVEADTSGGATVRFDPLCNP
jgi:hypothetical protein